MDRIISPAEDQLQNLRTPLTPGEQLVFNLFKDKLPNWHIFIQPHLNGLRPDFVLLNPQVGIGVFEIKDWDLDAIEYFIDEQSGFPKLKAMINGEPKSKQKENPIEKICLYKEEIFNLYCPRLDQKAGLAVITAGVIFPFVEDNRVKELFRPYINYLGIDGPQKSQYYPISGKQALDSKNIKLIFPASAYNSSKYMDKEVTEDLMIWLREPDFAAEQREELVLNDKQKKFATKRTKHGYRRIRGPAGSGKSLVLAARAAELAKDKKDVIVLTYNITLPNYIGDLAVRWPKPGIISRNDLTLISFFDWCKRFCSQMGYRQEYKNIWKAYFNNNNIKEEELSDLINANIDSIDNALEDIIDLVDSIINDDKNKNDIFYYDAILIDECQLFTLKWVKLLRKLCKNNGEMLLVADKTQDIYGKAQSWTDLAMEGAGFTGKWAEFRETHRLPPKLITYANQFAEGFLPKEIIDLPEFRQLDLNLYPCNLRWVQTTENKACEVSCNEIYSLMRPHNDLSVADIVFLSSNKKIGSMVVNNLKQKNIKCLHTFSADGRENRRQKHGFYKGDSRVKATTIHSFVGWEARKMVIYIGEAINKSLIYSGLTRLKRHENMSFLTVVCSVPELEQFGSKWEDFAICK